MNIVAESCIRKNKSDKTIEAKIVSSAQKDNGIYKVEFDGYKFDVYATNGQIYKDNQYVYVLIPQYDFNKQKYIIGSKNSNQIYLGTNCNYLTKKNNYGSIFIGNSEIKSSSNEDLLPNDSEYNTIFINDKYQYKDGDTSEPRMGPLVSTIHGNFAIYAGNEEISFGVRNDGTLYSIKGNIGGFDITAQSLIKPNVIELNAATGDIYAQHIYIDNEQVATVNYINGHIFNLQEQINNLQQQINDLQEQINNLS